MNAKKLSKRDYPFVVYHEEDTGYYIAEFPDLPGCYTEAKTLRTLMKNLFNAKYSWIKTSLEFGKDIPEPTNFDFSGRFTLRIPKVLHRELKDSAKCEGISLNQFLIYILSEKKKYYVRPISKPTNRLTVHSSTALILRVPRSLHRVLVERALIEGVSLNQFILYILSEYKEDAPTVFIPDYRNDQSAEIFEFKYNQVSLVKESSTTYSA
ncbi:toxin-antitoxin system HicB family antitoxin [Candidatus Dependentiae bacterium]|nr:toxin-antitoxin system HicB family antitoxin [Candidatus Dependentiae bacterium]